MAARRNTTATEPSPRPPSRLGLLAAALLAGGLGICLSVIALPQLAAGVQMLKADQVLFDLSFGNKVAPDDLARASAGIERAIARSPSPEAYSALGLIRYEQAVATDPELPLSRRQLGDSIAAERAALARDPAAPFDWLRLAQATFTLNGARSDVVAPLRMSLVTGAFEPGLQLPRLNLAFRLWSRLDQPTRAAIARQIPVAVAGDPKGVAIMARRYYVRLYVREALSRSPGRLAAFDAAYDALTSTP